MMLERNLKRKGMNGENIYGVGHVSNFQEEGCIK
jgi:hypothetical protein